MVNPPELPVRPERTRPLRIAYVIQNAVNRLADDVGEAILIKQKIQGLRKTGHHVDVFKLQGPCVTQFPEDWAAHQERQAPLGVTGSRPFKKLEGGIRRLQLKAGLPYFAFFDSFRFYEACCRFLPHYDICHEYSGLFSLGATLACRKLGVPRILTVEADYKVEHQVAGKSIAGVRGLVADLESKFSYRRADGIITVSETAKENLEETWNLDPEKIHVLQNGVDTNLFRPDYDGSGIRKKLGLKNGEPTIVFVGGFQSWHGLDHLLESFVKVRRVIPEARLLMVGDGPLRTGIEQTARESSLGGSVIFSGLVPQVRVPEILAAADIAVLPYPKLPKELWFSPLKLFEYMAAGKAIVASKAGQIATVLQDQMTGILVEPGNVPELTRALTSLCQKPEMREGLALNARKQAVDKHSWDHYVEQLEDLYYGILENRRLDHRPQG